MGAAGEFEEVENSLFLHQPRGERKIAFLILRDIFARFVRAPELVRHIETVKNLFEQIRNRHVLENAAAKFSRQLPHLRRDGHLEFREVEVPLALRKSGDDSVQIASRLPRVLALHTETDFLSDQLVEIDSGAVVGQQVEFELEKLIEPLVAGKTAQ